MLILGVSNVLNFFTLSKHRTVITADMRVYVISLSNIAFSLANTLIIVFLAQNGVGLVELRFWALAAAFLRAGILSLYCHKRYAFIDEKAEPNFAALNKSKDALFHEVLYALYKGAPIALITLILRDMAVVSVYNVYSHGDHGHRGTIGRVFQRARALVWQRDHAGRNGYVGPGLWGI